MMATANSIIAAMTLLFVSGAFAAEPATSDAQSPAEPARTTTAPAATQSEQKPPANTQSGRPAQQPSAGRQQSGVARANDRLDLDTTVVTGNRELPKVLYIVPWKKADLGDLPAQPFNTLLDEVLTPVDRDVFRREVTYYDAVSSGGNESAPPAQSPPQPSEK